jgi:hypothetical protein
MNRRQFGATLLGGAAASLLSRDLLAFTAAPMVNGNRLNAHLSDLGQFGRNPQGGVTRLA